MDATLRVLWVPHAGWHEPQRERFFAEQMAKQVETHVTDWPTRYRGCRDYLTLSYLNSLRSAHTIKSNVHVHQVPRISPALPFPTIRRINDRIYRRSIEIVARQAHVSAIIGSYPVSAPLTELPLILDICDDHPAYWKDYGRVPNYADEIVAHERDWARKSRVVVVATSVLRERAVARYRIPAEKIQIIPNGINLSWYVPARDRLSVRVGLGLDPKLRYVGVIGSVSRRPEAETILAVARRFLTNHSVRILIVGAGSEMSYLHRQARYGGLTNMIFAGFQSDRTLLGFHQALDVGLCPYRITTGAHAALPLRLLHYTAVGTTVVSSRLEEVSRMGFPNVILTDDRDEAFIAGVERALEYQPGRPREIEAFDLAELAGKYRATVEACL